MIMIAAELDELRDALSGKSQRYQNFRMSTPEEQRGYWVWQIVAEVKARDRKRSLTSHSAEILYYPSRPRYKFLVNRNGRYEIASKLETVKAKIREKFM